MGVSIPDSTVTAGSRAVFDRARRDREGLLNVARLQDEIGRAGLDAVIASSQVNVIYTSGAYLAIDVVPVFVVTTASGERAAVVNEADAEFLRAYSTLRDVRSFRFGPNSEQDAVAAVGDALTDLGLGESSLGIEVAALSSARLALLKERCPRAHWRDAGPVFERTRMVKTERELEVLAAAASVTALAIEAAFAQSDRRDTEKSVAARIQANALLAGADDLSHANVNAGVHSTLGHSISLEKAVDPGEVIHVDFGAKFGGYCTDVSRNAVMAAPSDKQRDIYRRLFDIHLRLLDWLRPGLTAGEVFTRTEAEFARSGLTYPWGTIGHSIGLAMHEGFEMAAGSEVVLEPGMVVCVEPSHIEPGDARYDVEDMVVVREDGVEILSTGAETAAMYEIDPD
jgi:Xaa-Pro aminopeptidase